MLINQLKDTDNLSPTYLAIAQFILDHPHQAIQMNSQELAAATFTSAAALTRFSRKLGYRGFKELKIRIAEEIKYFSNEETFIDVNLPLKPGQNSAEVAKTFRTLYTQTINTIYHSLDYESLAKAASLILNADLVTLYGTGSSLLIAENFYLKLRKIGIPASCDSLMGFQHALKRRHSLKETAVFVSHYLNNEDTKQLLVHLKEYHYRIILITANTSSLLTKLADVLFVVDNLEQYIKMGPFSSQLGETFLLDILYGIIFERHFEANLQFIKNNNGGLK